MSEKQLTVAELLARSGKTQNEGTTPRRRRRRSLEEGGISVAELTGNIPKVDAKPAESKHSSQPIDAESKSNSGGEGEVADFSPAKVEAVAPAPAPEFEESKLATDETIVLSVVDENDPVRLTTGSFKAVTPADNEVHKETEQEPAAAIDTFPAVTADVEPATDETPVVQEAEVPTTGFAKVDNFSPAPEAQQAATPVPVGYPDAPLPEQYQDADELAAEEEEEGSVSAGVVIGMALVGVILGAAVFKVFELLWANLSTPVVAGLGLVVTAAVVGVVHMLRTERDGLSKALAVVVTLVMTFGPALIS